MNASAINNNPKIGLWTATALVAGNMVGSGVFLLPAALARFGSISLIGWLLSSVGALCLALLFAKLSQLLPKSGGPYAYANQAFGHFTGFMIAWGYWIGIWSGNAAIALSAAGYLSVLIPWINKPTHLILTAIASVWLLTWVNTRSIKLIGNIQIITTVLKLLPLCVLGTLGWFFIDFHHYLPFNQSSQANALVIATTTTLTFWSFIGIESATIPSTHIAHPQKNIPRATLIGTGLTAIIYISSTLVIMGLLPAELLKSSPAPFADATRPLLGNLAYYLFAASGAIACLGTLNGWILLQGQIPLAAAQNNLFPAVFSKLNAFALPSKGIVISSILITVLIMLNLTKQLVDLYLLTILLATFTTVIPYTVCALSLPIIFKKQNTKARITDKTFMKIVVLSLISFLYSLVIIYGIGKRIVVQGFFLLLLGIPIYIYMRKKYYRAIRGQ